VGLLSTSSFTLSGDAQAYGPRVLAQTTPAWKVKKDAKAAYVKGKDLMKKGDYAGAVTNFEKADSLVPGAAPKYQIAVCYDKLGDAGKAVEAYKRFISSNPGEKYADRVVAAGKRIAELEKKLIGKVTLVIDPPGLAGVAVTVDGNPATGTELELKPGDHTVIVTAEGHKPATQTVTVKAGEPLDLPVTLEPESAVTPPPPPPPDDVVDEDGGSTPGMGLRIAGYTTFGITVVGGVLTGVFGAMALGSASDFDETPTTDLADDAENQALLADVFLGVTGAAAIATGILLYFGYTADDGEEASAAIPKIDPYGGPQGGGANLTWTF
jgi:hypothetical protein